MATIGTNAIADLFFQINWNSGDARHTDAYAGRMVNFWRDLMPRRLQTKLLHKRPGDRLELGFTPGELFTNGTAQDLRKLTRRQFLPSAIDPPNLRPRIGRFYPKGVLTDVAGVFTANREPFRVVEMGNGHLTVDMGHPLAGKELSLSVTVGAVRYKKEERGGALQEWITTITQGVGMQARWHDQPTDYFSDTPFLRYDETPDAIFYKKPRMVQHLDDTALDIVRQLYGRLIGRDMHVLDLMSSAHSHIPSNEPLKQVTGVGLNELELQKNHALTDYRVQDLNDDPVLPFPDNLYDAIVCTVSVEYLTDPVAAFAEVARVLRPGGYFIVTFSNRWFPPKVVKIWTELHEFERMGLVLEYFRNTRLFTNLQTYSVRGLVRPRHDKYFGQLPFADPVYAVWGSKR